MQCVNNIYKILSERMVLKINQSFEVTSNTMCSAKVDSQQQA